MATPDGKKPKEEEEDFWYLTNVFREIRSRDIFSSLYGYRQFINPKSLPLNLSLIQ